jgi:hypothetical protein
MYLMDKKSTTREIDKKMEFFHWGFIAKKSGESKLKIIFVYFVIKPI